MNIRAVTVERGIATLAHQSRPSILFSFSSHGGRNPHNASVGQVSASSVDATSSPTDIPAGQEEEELEGGFYDDEDDDAWLEERDTDEDGEIIQMAWRGEVDVERGIPNVTS